MKKFLLSVLYSFLATIGLMLSIYICMLLYVWLIGFGLFGIVILVGILFFVGFFRMFYTEEIHFKMYMPKDKEEK